MSPREILQAIEDRIDRIRDIEEIHRALGDLERIHELTEPEFQERVADLIEKLTTRMREARQSG